jgi:hypothetical protein
MDITLFMTIIDEDSKPGPSADDKMLGEKSSSKEDDVSLDNEGKQL